MSIPFTKTDIFGYFENSGAGMAKRMTAIIGDPSVTVVLNDKLDETLNHFAVTFKEPIALKALNAVRNGGLVLFYAKPSINLPECLPFFRYTKNGNSRVAVNMTNFASFTEGHDGLDDLYGVEDMRKLYATLISAYINLVIPNAEDFPIKALEFGSIMWAKMYCKILNTTIGLGTNRNRYGAFFYYAVRFFLTYIVGAPQATIDSISASTIKAADTNQYISAVEDFLSKDSTNISKFYGSFTGFCQTMFNNEITNTKSLRMAMANPNDKLNVSFYLKRFIDAYYQSSVMSLASAHYFTWLLMCTQKKAFMVNIKMLNNVFDSNTEIPRYLAALYSEAESKRY